MKNVFKQPLFLIGFLFITLMLVASFTYTFIWGIDIRKLYYIYENGKLVEGAPLSPRWSFPFGTDQLGYDLLGKILIGAKYTILATIAVAALRVLIALPFGFLLGTFFSKQKNYINGLIDSFHYVPLTIIAYYILRPVLWEPFEGFQTSLAERLIVEVLILSLLTVPVIVVLIGNEASLIHKQEFVLSAKTLGAGPFRIIRKHIYPVLREKLFIIFGQEMMQTLIILSHLGLLRLFLGGTNIDYSGMADPPRSISYEWSGLIGDAFRYIQTAPWIPLTPILFFAATILSVAFMIEGYVRATSGRSHYFKKPRKMNRTNINKKELYQPTPEDFEYSQKTG
ncbi:ABC transporter permease [Rossellomorea aquimaris]|uniref:ABC transporter permease n=1 Tax=Rossellomorea aquimaris TaxID=189382 RepID=UPI0007D06AAE|nr:ABC transporter permease subunit [Rossellomorea aquimaris]